MSREREETRDEYLNREEQHEIEQQARFALDMANRLAAPAKREEARLRLTCAALTGILSGDSSTPGGAIPHDKVAVWSVGLADEVLALLYPEVPNDDR